MKPVNILRTWYEHGWLRAVDLSLADYLLDKLGDDAESVAFLAALTSHQLGHGHPCLDLKRLSEEADTVLQLPPEHASFESKHACLTAAQALAQLPNDWLTQLQDSLAVNQANSPLVLANKQRLYLRRYYNYEQAIKSDLAQRCEQQDEIDVSQLRETLNALFGVSEQLSWQRLACAMAVRSGFTIITGGPGTGKTYTVVRLLATLQQHRTGSTPLRIRLAAPTGKAAARMTSSIEGELGNLPEQFRATLESTMANRQAVTLHRLLGSQNHSREFKHNRRNPLLADVVIVDEASMVDIEMMAALTSALAPGTRLILLGDKDQLASVEAGAVLGQLCEHAEHGHYAPELAEWLADSHGLAELPQSYADKQGASTWPYLQHTVMLHESRRFNAEQGIGKLAHEVNTRQTQWLARWLQDAQSIAAENPAFNNIHTLEISGVGHKALRQLVQEGYQPLLDLLQQGPDADVEQWGEQLLAQLEQFQLLAAVRSGDWGVENLNKVITQWLFGEQVSTDKWFVGRPVMITQNDYSVDLRNGDIGLAVRTAADEPIRVLFRGTSGELRWLLPSRLAHVETAFAMTIHKSQGSEFNHTVVVMPDHDSPILTKELLYTGITRASEHCTLVFKHDELVLRATERRIQRSGGLT
ncbi:exodeoxyribonuclease V subunit alpha [Pseudidiomarina homiensis]|uniref:RecBCD enzyme subunit RecD n=1 Tax=Pseudidiomarina homiensis TaxID=364198 RepID=A0A432XXX9_9GAMM|nr:exodeoxyribonuclease V subunit alpha [Pseudidiomarina homiensis]RUO53592.1 exodeoxyribonuclease V subunit alpha [Pseudidiomarina homiensis]